MDSVPNPFPNREKGEDERLTDLYGRLPKDNIARLLSAEDNLEILEADTVTNAAAIVLKLQTQTYTERWDDITHAVDTTWEDVDLSAHGVLEGDVCEILFICKFGVDNDIGVRTNGSSLSRLITTANGVDAVSQTTMNVVAAASSLIELYLQDASDFEVFLSGYWRFSTS